MRRRRRCCAPRGREVALREGTRVFEPGQAADAFLIVTRGVVKVHLTAANGREILLYRVEAGESCVLTTSCLLDFRGLWRRGHLRDRCHGPCSATRRLSQAPGRGGRVSRTQSSPPMPAAWPT